MKQSPEEPIDLAPFIRTYPFSKDHTFSEQRLCGWLLDHVTYKQDQIKRFIFISFHEGVLRAFQNPELHNLEALYNSLLTYYKPTALNHCFKTWSRYYQIPLTKSNPTKKRRITKTLDVSTVQISRAELIKIMEGMKERVHVFDREPCTIGRHQDNDVQITGDSKVSRRHCRIYCRDTQYYIEDLQSSNGTLVNGALISEHLLQGGDEIQIGESIFRFQCTTHKMSTYL